MKNDQHLLIRILRIISETLIHLLEISPELNKSRGSLLLSLLSTSGFITCTYFATIKKTFLTHSQGASGANKLSYRTNAGFSFCLQAWCVIGPTTYPKINIQCLNALRSALHLVQNTTLKYLCQSNHRINAQNIFLNKKPIYLLKDTPYFMNNVLGLSCFILCNILYV